ASAYAVPLPLSARLLRHAPHEPTVTVTPVLAPRFALSSTARLRMPTIEPAAPGVQLYVHVWRPVAGCHVRPPSVETSTAPTMPPMSVAVPVMVMGVPGVTCAPFAGAVMLV